MIAEGLQLLLIIRERQIFEPAPFPGAVDDVIQDIQLIIGQLPHTDAVLDGVLDILTRLRVHLLEELFLIFSLHIQHGHPAALIGHVIS